MNLHTRSPGFRAMSPMRNRRPGTTPVSKSQKGMTLYVVIVLVLLSMLLALWAARSALFGEVVVGNDADYRRTFEAAQAMLQDAELDIRGAQPSGSSCVPDPAKGDVCRRSTSVFFDIETKDLEKTLSDIETQKPIAKCYKGICQKRAGPQDFWNDATALSAMTAQDVGAFYGQFTGADAATTANPILSSSPKIRAWYWVEVLPYVDPNVSLLANMPPGSNVERLAPSRKKPWVYRITALAQGNKPGTMVVLQSTLSLQAVE